MTSSKVFRRAERLGARFVSLSWTLLEMCRGYATFPPIVQGSMKVTVCSSIGKETQMSKGTGQTYSFEVYEVKQKNDETRKNVLLHVPKSEETTEKTRNVVKEATKARQIQNQLNREDIVQESVKRKPREWKPTRRALETFQ